MSQDVHFAGSADGMGMGMNGTSAKSPPREMRGRRIEHDSQADVPPPAKWARADRAGIVDMATPRTEYEEAGPGPPARISAAAAAGPSSSSSALHEVAAGQTAGQAAVGMNGGRTGTSGRYVEMNANAEETEVNVVGLEEDGNVARTRVGMQRLHDVLERVDAALQEIVEAQNGQMTVLRKLVQVQMRTVGEVEGLRRGVAAMAETAVGLAKGGGEG